MLTRLIIRGFKQFDEIEVELGNPVVFIGPNNSGKTTALQALALWNVGLKKWFEKGRANQPTPEKRPGVSINRRDLISVPVPAARLLWKDLHVRDVQSVDGKPYTKNIRIEVVVEGWSSRGAWRCGLEFDYANEESFYCRPLRVEDARNPDRMPIPDEAREVTVSFLQPMSGLASEEYLKQSGEIGVLIGQGRTAEVLRNLCRHLWQQEDKERWQALKAQMQELFGIELGQPDYVPETSRILMSYRDRNGTELDLTSAGRGLQQTLLLLAYLAANPGTTVLLDEPDAHLEILRQRQIYHTLSEAARQQGSQIVMASHSEVILDEAADRDVVVAFVGKPHRIDDRGSAQVRKSLKAIGFDQYSLAELVGWVLYLEGSTDLAVLRAFARTLEHPATQILSSPFVHYVGNQPQQARDHFHGLREAKPDLVGFLLCDRLDRELQSSLALTERMWTRREIENYLCHPQALLRFAEKYWSDSPENPSESGSASLFGPPGGLFESGEAQRRRLAMQQALEDMVPRIALADPGDPYWVNTKISDDLLDRLFPMFLKRVGLPDNLMRKTDYHRVAEFMPRDLIDDEVSLILTQIVDVFGKASPRS